MSIAIDTMQDNCFALLDDASAGDGVTARSRLYTGHADTLTCTDAATWPDLLARMQAALARGLYAVPVLTYELGGHLLKIDAHPIDAPLAQVLLFERFETLSALEVADWLAARTGTSPAGVAAITPSVDQAAFTDALARINAYIAAGDTYQVNFTYRLRFDAFGSVYSAVRPPARASAGAVWRPGGPARRPRGAVAVSRTVRAPRRRRTAGAADEGHRPRRAR